MTSTQANTVKICASDQEDGDARCLMVWNSTLSSIPDPLTSTNWNFYQWSTGSDYQSMYSGLVDSLNSNKLPDGTSLSVGQVYYSNIAMTNYHGGNATLSLWYRGSSDSDSNKYK